MNNRRAAVGKKGVLTVLLTGLALGGLRGWAEQFGVKDLDFLLKQIPSTLITSFTPQVTADGDFNGDGYDDMVISVTNTNDLKQNIYVLFGGPSVGSVPFDERNFVKISLPFDDYHYNGPVLFLDLNGDGKDDLVFAAFNSSDHLNSKIYVVFGSSQPSLNLNWDGPPMTPDLEIQFPRNLTQFNLAKCDFNGDGCQDLLVEGGPNVGVYLLFGKPKFSNPVLQIDDGVSASWFHQAGVGFGTNMLGADINKDGKSDLVFSAPGQIFNGRSGAGEVQIVFGTTTFFSAWDFDAKTADLQIGGAKISSQLSCLAAGDYNGDGVDDLLFSDHADNKIFLIDGHVLATGPRTVDMGTGIPGFSPPTVPRPSVSTLTTVGHALMGDFDGDGKADIFCNYNGYALFGYLSRDWSGQPNVSPAAVEFWTTSTESFGDINGDGRKDLMLLPFGAGVGFIFGYQPLDNPAIRVKPSPAFPKITLDSSVEGAPVEMNISGDFVETLNGKWVPFQSSLPLTMTQTPGEKHFTAVFRNSFGRKSGLAETAVTLAAGSPGLEVVNNMLDSSGRGARVDCHLPSRAHVKAAVHDQTGTLIAPITDSELDAGVWPMEWDGKNASGRSAGPGVYYMVIEVDGRAEKKKILVQR